MSRIVEACGGVAALLGLVAIVRRSGSWSGLSELVVDAGAGTLLLAGGISFVLQRRSARHQAVAARLIAVFAAFAALVGLFVSLVSPSDLLQLVERFLPSALLVLVATLALLGSLAAGRRIGPSAAGVLGAFMIALATVLDVSRFVFGDAAGALPPLSRATLVGLALLGVALMLDSARRWAAEKSPPIAWLPVAVTLFLATFAVGLSASVLRLEGGLVRESLERPLSAVMLFGGLVLALLAGLVVGLAQTSLGRLLTEAQRLRASEKRYRELSEKRARAALAASEARYRELFDTMAVGVFQSTPDGELLMVNPALVEILGYDSAPEVLALDLETEIYADRSTRRRLVERLEKEGEIRDREIRLVDKEGREVVGLVSARLVDEEHPFGGKTITGTLLDITEQKRLEGRLAQAQKMEAIGQLAGGIAHDFNNLLTAIGGYADLALGTLADEAPERKEIVQIRRAAERAGNLTHQLLAFSRQQVLEPEVIDIAELLGDVEGLLRRVLGEQVVLETRLEPDLGAVRMDPTQLEQVLLNLAVNGRDAMPRGGRLLIAAENVQMAVEKLELAVGQPATSNESGSIESRGERAWVRVAVRDEGEGMDPWTSQRAIEPFFTTKPRGRGTGLGLSTVFGIVEQSGGVLEIDSEPGRGTEIAIYLERIDLERPADREPAPREGPAPVVESASSESSEAQPSEAQSSEAQSSEAQPSDAEPAGESILLVEDDPQVRHLVTELLAGAGYEVQAAEGAEAALACFEDGHDPDFDLVLTDVVLPGLTGFELVERLRGRDVDCSVLYMSGYSTDRFERGDSLAAGVDYLSKPFVPKQLLRKIEEILQRD